ncbi:MAG: hypothetical protein U1E76_04815 [Planctomycetota bacterium]
MHALTAHRADPPLCSLAQAIVPEQAIYFATAMPLGQAALGLLIESRMGRPPRPRAGILQPGRDRRVRASVAADDVRPDRSQAIHKRGRIATWPAFLEELSQAMAVQRARQGAGLRVLSETITSPTLNAQRIRLLEAFPFGTLAAVGSEQIAMRRAPAPSLRRGPHRAS